MKHRHSTLAVAFSLVLGLLVVVVPGRPAQAACDTDTLNFATGTAYKASSHGTASSGTCSDVNMRYYHDGDGCNGEYISHKAYVYSAQFGEYLPGTEGWVLNHECTWYSDRPLSTNVATGTEYYFYSQQSGAYAYAWD